MKIPITKPYFDDDEKEYLLKPLESGWLVQGPYVSEFEKTFCEYTGASFSKAVTSCTTALHLVLLSLGIGKDDKVIVPAFTYIASANAVEYTGAEIIFCDIDLKTFNIDINQLEYLLSKNDRNIKAVMPVNLFGLCADLNYIINIAKNYNLKVIEDSACGLGAYLDSKHSGTFGDAGCFSFHPRKSITTGEGGMIVTNNEDISEKTASLRDHGASKSDLERHLEKGGSLLPEFNIKGYNYRMTDLQGALGVSQMKKADHIINTRRKIAEKYNYALNHIKELLTPLVPEGYIHGYQSYVCLFVRNKDISSLTMADIDELNIERNKIMQRLEKYGIATRQGTHAVHTLGYYRNKYGFKDEYFINSYAADRLSIALPLYAGMNNDEFEYIIDCLTKVIQNC